MTNTGEVNMEIQAQNTNHSTYANKEVNMGRKIKIAKHRIQKSTTPNRVLLFLE